MGRTYNEPIPENKMRQFHEILCATGGRYISNPEYYPNLGEWRVSYTHGDYAAMNNAWRMVNQDVKEVRKDQRWRRMLRRVFK